MTQKEYIISESAKLFGQHGLKSIRMDDIALQLGVSKRTIYELFTNKEDLITACIEFYFSQQDQNDNRIRSESPNVVEAFLALIEAWDEGSSKHIQLLDDMRRFYPKIFREVMTRRHERGIENLKCELKKGIDEQIFIADLNIDFAATVFTNAIYALFMQPNSYVSNTISLTEAFKYITVYFFRGIATRKGTALIDTIIKNKQSRQQIK